MNRPGAYRPLPFVADQSSWALHTPLKKPLPALNTGKFQWVDAPEVSFAPDGPFAGDPVKKKASLLLKTYNPDYFLSGLIVYWGGISSASVETLGDVYRLALYTGKPVEVPPDQTKVLPPLDAQLLPRAAGALRRAVVRGEVVTMQAVLTAGANTAGPAKLLVVLWGNAPHLRTCQLAQAGTNPEAEEEVARFHARTDKPRLFTKEITANLEPGQAVTVPLGKLSTADLGVGDYELSLEVAHLAAQGVLRVSEPLAICPAPRLDRVRHTIGGYISQIRFRGWALLDWPKGMGLGPETNIEESWGPIYDGLLRNGQIWIGTHNTAIGQGQLGPAGQPAEDPWGCIAGADTRNNAYRDCLGLGRIAQAYPSFGKAVVINDDWSSACLGWDYSLRNLAELKAKTGFDAPVPPEVAKDFRQAQTVAAPTGSLPDRDP